MRMTVTALPITSAGRFWPLCPVGIRRNLNQRSDEPQQSLVFGTFRLSVQKRAQLDVRQPPPRRGIRLMNNERMAILGLASEEPRVPVGATIQLSSI